MKAIHKSRLVLVLLVALLAGPLVTRQAEAQSCQVTVRIFPVNPGEVELQNTIRTTVRDFLCSVDGGSPAVGNIEISAEDVSILEASQALHPVYKILVIPVVPSMNGIAYQVRGLHLDHEFSAMFGGRLTYWFIPEMGAELELLFAPSALETDPFGLPGTVDAQFFSLNARLVYAFGSDSNKPYFLLTGGLGLWATNYEDYDMTTGGMGVVALGLRIPMDNALSIRIDLSDYMTTTNWELASGGETDKILQHDLALTVGLSITLNKK